MPATPTRARRKPALTLAETSAQLDAAELALETHDKATKARGAGPDVSDDELARLVVRRFVLLERVRWAYDRKIECQRRAKHAQLAKGRDPRP